MKYYQFEQDKNNIKSADEFINENLYNDDGRIVLLFDGYDELEKSARKSISALLNNFLGTHKNIPVVITSRTEVYEKELAFNKIADFKIDMAPFTPYAILKFLSLWKFEEGKSSYALFNMIKGKAHLLELASNPLMLTIITFLYTKPKYTLPDNRVKFYDLCTRALLEEWDRTQQKDRDNKFESHQKIAVLSKIAFEHISQASTTDELISEQKIHNIIKEEMKRLSFRDH